MDHHVVSPWGCCPRKLSRQIVKPRARPDVDCGLLPEQRMPYFPGRALSLQHSGQHVLICDVSVISSVLEFVWMIRICTIKIFFDVLLVMQRLPTSARCHAPMRQPLIVILHIIMYPGNGRYISRWLALCAPLHSVATCKVSIGYLPSTYLSYLVLSISPTIILQYYTCIPTSEIGIYQHLVVLLPTDSIKLLNLR